MALSLYGESFLHGKDFIINHHRIKKFKDPKNPDIEKFLLSTDLGSWIALNKEEYQNLIKQNVSDEFFKILEEKAIILTRNNIEMMLQNYRLRYDFLFDGTGLHIILPTLRCNKKCTYCHSSVKSVASKNTYDMDIPTAKKTLDFIFQNPNDFFTIEFQGGETLLNFKTFKYIVTEGKRLANEKNKTVRFELVSNLTMMNDELLDWLKEEKIHLTTSLDGPRKVHDANRVFESGAPTYDAVISGIKKAQAKKVPLSALMVTTKQSLPHWKEIIDEYVSHGFKEIQLKYLHKLGYADVGWDDQGYTIEEFMVFWKKGVDYMIELSRNGTIIKERYVMFALNKIFNKRDPGMLDFRSPCGIVIGQMAYNYNGDIYSCDEGRNFDMFKLGNVKEDTYEKILSSTKAQQLVSTSINDNLMCDSCAYKPWCGTCIVLNYSEEGNPIPILPNNSHHKLFDMIFEYVFNALLFDPDKKEILTKWFSDH